MNPFKTIKETRRFLYNNDKMQVNMNGVKFTADEARRFLFVMDDDKEVVFCETETIIFITIK